MKKLSQHQVIKLVYLAATFDFARQQSYTAEFLQKIEQELGVRLTGPQWAATGKMTERFREEVQLLARHLIDLEAQPVPHNDNLRRRFRKDIPT